MKTALSVIDDFCPDAELLREWLIAGEFVPYVGPDGQTYTVSNLNVPVLKCHLEGALERKVDIKLSGFRLDLAGTYPGCAVHSDEICAEYAGILYLNPPEQCKGGTAFWKHSRTGLDEMPADDKEKIHADWNDQFKWSQSGYVDMKFNRFITYPTRKFHSRWPLEGFGDNKHRGRLIWVVFFNMWKEEHTCD